MRRRTWLVAVVVSLAFGCNGGSDDPKPPPGGNTVGGSIAGLGGASGLVLGAGGQTLNVPAGATSYVFPNNFADGTYELSITAPAGMSCVAANDGVIAVSGAAVTNADVECAALTFTLGGAVTGMPTGSVVLQDGAGHQVTVEAEGPFVFPARLAAGTQYAVSVVTPPAGRTCTVANGSGTIGSANVTNVAVSCGAATFTVGGAVNGLAAEGLQISSTIPGSTPLAVQASDTRYELPVRAPNGTYQLSVTAVPAGVTCTFGGSATASVTVSGANVTNADVTCVGVVMQRWVAPTTWGGSAQTFWPDDDPTLVQHAYFTASGIQETKSETWALAAGAPATIEPLDAFPAGPRFGAGPFPVEGQNYQASTPDAALDLPGDMLVCAVFQPDTDPVANGWEKPIISKGIGNYTNYLLGGGWSLMQMNESFCFRYENLDARGQSRAAFACLPTFLADGNVYGPGNSDPRNTFPPPALRSPLPNWVVACGGRDGEELVIAANTVESMRRSSLAPFGPAPHTLDAAVESPATIGGFADPLGITNSFHAFNGRVFETAVWNEPATAENVREKLAVVQGLAQGVSYVRNRPGPFQFAGVAGGAYHTTWHNGARVDPAKGMLFGMQSWNRVNGFMPPDGNTVHFASVFPASEDLRLWTQSGGAAVADDASAVSPARIGSPAQRVTLPAGASLSIALDEMRPNPVNPGSVPTTRPPAWRSRGLVHGQIWLRVASAQPAGSVLRVQKTDPNPDSPGFDHQDIDLSTLAAGTWTRVWLNTLSTAGSLPGTLSLQNAGSGPIAFNAWGIALTQIGGGGDLNSISAVPIPFSQPSPDPGPFMYDWSGANDYEVAFASSFVEDVLQPPALSGSTASTGFCLSVDARPADAFAWDVRMHDSRTPIAWANSPDPAQVTRVLRLYVDGLDGPNPGQICFGSRALATPGDWASVQPEQVVACGPIPAGWTAGSPHNLKACSTPAGALTIYADSAAIATGTLAGVPDLGTGRLLVGNGANRRSSNSSPWHGYVSAAAACRATSDVSVCR